MKYSKNLLPIDQRRAPTLLLTAALLMAAVAYAPSVGFGFVDDDHAQIVQNPRIRSWHEVPGYFTTNVWAHLTHVLGDLPPPYYRPVFLVWLFANYQVFRADPAGWHLMVVLLHLLVAVLAYLLVRTITRDPLLSAITAALFALHPVHVEGVVWISGVPEPLMAALFLASLLCYLKARENAGWLWPVLSGLLFFLAMLAKETAIILPAVLWAYELTLGADRRNLRLHLRRITPYAGLAFVYLVLRHATLAGTFTSSVPWAVQFLTWPSVLWTYPRHLIWPVNLTIVCDLPYVTRINWSGFILPCIALSLCAVGLWVAARRHPIVGFAALWMALLILPPLYLRGLATGEITHDRYLYLPSLGFCVLAALVVTRLPAGRALLMFLLGLAALGVYRESKPYVDDVALFEHALRLAPENVRAQRQLALALPGMGRCADAIPILERLRQRQEDPRVLLGLGGCFYSQERFEKAEPLILRTIALSPRYQPTYSLLIGIKLAQNRLAEAESIWRQAMAIPAGPADAPGLHLLGGQILRARGDLPGAAAEFTRELAVDPENERARLELDEVEEILSRGRAH